MVCVPSRNAMKDFSNSNTQIVLIISIFVMFYFTYFIYYAASSIFFHPVVKDMRKFTLKWYKLQMNIEALCFVCVCVCVHVCVFVYQ